MSAIFDKDTKALEDEEEERMMRAISKRGKGTPRSITPRAAAPSPSPVQAHTKKASSTSSGSLPAWKQREIEKEKEAAARAQAEKEAKERKAASLPAAHLVPDDTFVGYSAPVSGVDAIGGHHELYCNHCGKGVGPGDMYCPNCAQKMDPITREAPAKLSFCTDCGSAQTSADQKFCPDCGTKFANSSSSSTSTSASISSVPVDEVARELSQVDVFGDNTSLSANEEKRLESVTDQNHWFANTNVQQGDIYQDRTQPDGWVIKVVGVPATPTKPFLLQVGVGSSAKILFRGGERVVSQTFNYPVTKAGKIPFTVEVPAVPFQQRKPFDSKKGHHIKISLQGQDIVFQQSTKPF